MIGGIYQIRNLKNGKRYIGQANNLRRRWNEERSELGRNKNKPNMHLQNAWNRYGSESFVFEMLEVIDEPTRTVLVEREQYWVDFYNANNKYYGYNKRICVESCLGFKHSEETKDKLRNKVVSEETRKRMSLSSTGEKNGMFGRHHSEEAKKKIGLANRSKLTWTKVREMRKKYVPKVYSMHKLAEEYAVSIGTVFSIINNKTWKGVKKCH